VAKELSEKEFVDMLARNGFSPRPYLTEQAFRQALQAFGLSERDISTSAEVSIPTVRRWLSGVSAPHPLMRNTVLKFLAEAVEARSVEIEDDRG
jgi:hypothetical protein